MFGAVAGDNCESCLHMCNISINVYFLHDMNIFVHIQHMWFLHYYIHYSIIQWDSEESQVTYDVCRPC